MQFPSFQYDIVIWFYFVFIPLTSSEFSVLVLLGYLIFAGLKLRLTTSKAEHPLTSYVSGFQVLIHPVGSNVSSIQGSGYQIDTDQLSDFFVRSVSCGAISCAYFPSLSKTKSREPIGPRDETRSVSHVLRVFSIHIV